MTVLQSWFLGFFLSLLKVLCHCQEEHPCRTWPRRANSQGGEARLGSHNHRRVNSQWGPRRSCWRGDRSSDGLSGSPDGAPTSRPTGGPASSASLARSPRQPHPQELGICQQKGKLFTWREGFASKGRTQAGRTDGLVPQKTGPDDKVLHH